MQFNRVTLTKALDDEGKFIVLLLDSQLRNPFIHSSSPRSEQEAVKSLRKIGLPKAEIKRMFVLAETSEQ
jgi:hypothetical protein